ncbi:unnamed protein product [Heterobilharzia americana]|nr:unnamed protein product [Heterobilharzia americana]
MTDADCLVPGDGHICYQDLCHFLSQPTFNRLVDHFEKTTDTLCEDKYITHKAAEEIRKAVVSGISNSSGREIIFGSFFSEELCRTETSCKKLSQVRSLYCLMELLKMLIHDSNLNVILCILEVATILTQPFHCVVDGINNALPSGNTAKLSFADSEWLSHQLLHIICVALGDSNLVVRVAGSKLSLAVGSLPSCAMIVVRELAGQVFTYHKKCSSEKPKDEKEYVDYGFCSNKRTQLHQESIDVITTLLLTLPSSEFDLAEVCKLVILPGLTDLKLLVRIATLDCVAVVAHLLGAGDLGCLLAAVSRADNFLLKAAGDFLQHPYVAKDEYQSTPKYSTLLEAVQYRLAKRQLPQLDSHSRIIRKNNSVPGASILANTLGLSPNQNTDSQIKSCISNSVCFASTTVTTASTVKNSPLSASENQLNILSNLSTVQKVKYNYRRRPSAGLTGRRNQLPWDPRISINLSSSYPGKISSRLNRRNSNCSSSITPGVNSSSTEINYDANHLRKGAENGLLTCSSSLLDSKTGKHYIGNNSDYHVSNGHVDNDDSEELNLNSKISVTHRSVVINGKDNLHHIPPTYQQQEEYLNNPTNSSCNNFKSECINLPSTKRYPPKSQCSEFGSQSLPSSGRLSPTLKIISDQSAFEQTRVYPLRSSLTMAKSTSNSEEPSSFSTSRRKPRLAPIRHPSGGNQSDHPIPWTPQEQFAHNSDLISTCPSSLLPTRATLGRQSGRSRLTTNQVFNSPNTTTITSENYLERNRFGYSVVIPSNVSKPDHNQHSSSRLLSGKKVLSTSDRSPQSDRTFVPYNKLNYSDCATTRTNTDSVSLYYDHDDDNDVEEEIYDEDYESDEEYADSVGGAGDSSRTIDSGKFSNINRSKKPNSLPASALPLNLDNNDTVLAHSPGSEIPEVSSIRSAASHRRAMRLFEEAEKRREGDNCSNAQSLFASSAPVSSVKGTKLSSVDLVNRNCTNVSNTDTTVENSNPSVPSLTPAVVPAMPLQRLIPGKSSAKRRENITADTVNDADKSPGDTGDDSSPKTPTNRLLTDKKQSHSQEQQFVENSSSATIVSTKYNPYAGASFRQNRDYTGLVIGRAAGSPSLIAPADMHQPYQSIERRPLKGQHNIQSSMINSGGSLNHLVSPDSTSTVATNSSNISIPTSTSFNIIGRGLFDQSLVTSGKSNTTLSSSPSINKSISSTSGRQTPANYKHSEHSQIEHTVHHSAKDSELEGSNVLLGIGINEASAFTAGNFSSNVNDGDMKGAQEACVSHSFRQRILQKKSKKLQKLRDSSILLKQTPNNSPSSIQKLEVNQNQIIAEATHSPLNLDNDKPYSKLDSTEHPPSHSTWPPPTSNNARTNLSSKQDENSSKLKTSTTNSGALVVPSTRRRLPAENSLSRNLHSTSQSSVNNIVGSQSEKSSVNSNESVNMKSHSTETVTTIGDSAMKLSDYDKNPLPDKPLLKGRSAVNLNGTPLTLPTGLNLVNSDDWEDKVSGLELLAQIFTEQSIHLVQTTQTGSASAGSSRQLATNLSSSAPTLVLTTETLSQTVQAVITECRNLRSQVSRQAVQTMGSLFQGLNRAMDPHVDVCIRVLLSKTGEAAAAFLRDEVSLIMDEVIQHASPSRTLQALIQHGIGHKNPAVRLQTALLVSRIVENLSNHGRMNLSNRGNITRGSGGSGNSGSSNNGGSTNIGRLSSWSSTGNLNSASSVSASNLSSSNSVFLGGFMERLIAALSQFLTDGNQETRYYGRRLLSTLMQHPDFERTAHRQLSGQSLRALKEAMDQIHQKGVGDLPPSASSSAGVRRRGFSPATRSRGPSAGVGGSKI